MTEPTPYKEAFPAGTQVRVADRKFLDDFLATWEYHHKLQREQLVYADAVSEVEGVSLYQGGDPLYKRRKEPQRGLDMRRHLACILRVAHLLRTLRLPTVAQAKGFVVSACH
jgi:hypothetical protein